MSSGPVAVLLVRLIVSPFEKAKTKVAVSPFTRVGHAVMGHAAVKTAMGA